MILNLKSVFTTVTQKVNMKVSTKNNIRYKGIFLLFNFFPQLTKWTLRSRNIEVKSPVNNMILGSTAHILYGIIKLKSNYYTCIFKIKCITLMIIFN